MNYLNKINLKVIYGNKNVSLINFKDRHVKITSCHDIVPHDKKKKILSEVKIIFLKEITVEYPKKRVQN